MGATLVHPDLSHPAGGEPIIQQDGHTKNDHEHNATRRWLNQFRKEHPHLRAIIVEDALSSNAPSEGLGRGRVRYIIGVKPGDHTFLFEHLRALDEARRTQVLTLVDPGTDITTPFSVLQWRALNESNPDVLVNVLELPWVARPDGATFQFRITVTLGGLTLPPVMRVADSTLEDRE